MSKFLVRKTPGGKAAEAPNRWNRNALQWEAAELEEEDLRAPALEERSLVARESKTTARLNTPFAGLNLEVNMNRR